MIATVRIGSCLQFQRVCGVGVVLFGAVVVHAGTDPWADRVVSYSPGAGVPAGYNTPATALGSPARMTGQDIGFPSVVSPFSPPFQTGEIVAVGGGGHLTLAFDEPVTNDPGNRFGIDLIVFGHSGFIDDDYPAGLVRSDAARFGVGILPITEISADGVAWFPVVARVDDLFPTNAYLDLVDPYSPTAGLVESDYTRPVNPSLNPAGMTFAQLLAAYDGSGGGAGIDIGPTGLAFISYIRFTNPSDGPALFAIDAVSDASPVPSPAGGVGMVLMALKFARRRRRDT